MVIDSMAEQRSKQNTSLLMGWLSKCIPYDRLLTVQITGNRTDCIGSADDDDQNTIDVEEKIFINFKNLYLKDGKLAFILGEEISTEKLLLFAFNANFVKTIRPAESGVMMSCRVNALMKTQDDPIFIWPEEFLIAESTAESDWFAKRNRLYIEIDGANSAQIKRFLSGLNALCSNPQCCPIVVHED